MRHTRGEVAFLFIGLAALEEFVFREGLPLVAHLTAHEQGRPVHVLQYLPHHVVRPLHSLYTNTCPLRTCVTLVPPFRKVLRWPMTSDDISSILKNVFVSLMEGPQLRSGVPPSGRPCPSTFVAGFHNPSTFLSARHFRPLGATGLHVRPLSGLSYLSFGGVVVVSDPAAALTPGVDAVGGRHQLREPLRGSQRERSRDGLVGAAGARRQPGRHGPLVWPGQV